MKFKKFSVYGSIAIIIFVFFILAVAVFKDYFLSFTYIKKIFSWFSKDDEDIKNLNKESQNIDYAMTECIDTSSFRKNSYFNDVTNDHNKIFVDSQDVKNDELREYRVYEYNFDYPWLNEFIFYTAISDSEHYDFGDINLTEQEIKKIKDYIKKMLGTKFKLRKL